MDFLEEAEKTSNTNKYCSRSELDNEPSVETFFVMRLLQDLGYKDSEIKLKKSLEEITVARGREKERYKPDYALVCSDKPRWIIDAKAPSENVDDWTYQGAGYALGLNKKYRGENPCQYYVLTNGLELKVFKWDEEEPVLSLEFGDFVDDNQQFIKLRSLLGADIVRKGWATEEVEPEMVNLEKPPVEQVKKLFNSCHQLIWKTEKMNPQAAFYEFVKVLFVKLREDRKLHENQEVGPKIKAGQAIPAERIVFSKRWIEKREAEGVTNPIDTILFKTLAEQIEEAVSRGEKKPIFEKGEHIKLQPGTIKQVVKRLEPYDLFGVDEDLNGRLFETFLNATMRGKGLGQYFTPRSIVKLMVKLASPVARKERVDRILDACCGTGGFLIEALTDMRNQIRSNSALTDEERERLLNVLANESLFGIDAGREPPLARIARINMYLHGDGGSRVYAADSLDKKVQTGVSDDPQARRELEELRDKLLTIAKDKDKGFDIVLTNPPFSMSYSETIESEKDILCQYDLQSWSYKGTSKRRKSLRSGVMFLERYHDLLREGGKLLTVIDDSILSGPKYAFVRDFIREKFVVRAVISLPGDAFQRVGARAKTSILFLTKRRERETDQPHVFMYECQYVGLDDVPMKTRPSKAQMAKEQAENEIAEVVNAFKKFLSDGEGPYAVPGKSINDRLDVKHCLLPEANIESKWAESYKIIRLEDVLRPITQGTFNPQKFSEEEFTLLRIRYDGMPEEGERVLGKELSYKEVWHPPVGALVVSNIAAVLGSTCVVPPDLKHVIVTPEFTVMSVKDPRFHPWFLWAYLRSAEVRARLLSKSTGISRHRVSWDVIKNIPVPEVPENVQRAIGEKIKSTVTKAREAESAQRQAVAELASMLDLENQWAIKRLKAAKPPK